MGSAQSMTHVPKAVKDAYKTGVDPNLYFVSRNSEFEDETTLVKSTVNNRWKVSEKSCVRNINMATDSTSPNKNPPVLVSVVETIMDIVDGNKSPDKIINDLDKETLHEFARQRLEQLVPCRSLPSNGDEFTIEAVKSLMKLDDSIASPDERLIASLNAAKKSMTRAVFVPISKGQSDFTGFLPISSKCVTIGTSDSCDIKLPTSLCHRLSPQHATVVYDEFSDCYEMLVYSEFGVFVDGVHYGLGQAATPPTPVFSLNIEQKKEKDEAPRLPQLRITHCSCSKSSGSENESFDAAAQLHHGSVVQIGCYRFVFARLLMADVQRVVSELSNSVAAVNA